MFTPKGLNAMTNISRVSMKGQVTIPAALRKTLGIKKGDKIVFAQKGGNIVLFNSNRFAFEEFQRDMAGEAERAGWAGEQDILNYCNEIRRELSEGRNEDNA